MKTLLFFALATSCACLSGCIAAIPPLAIACGSAVALDGSGWEGLTDVFSGKIDVEVKINPTTGDAVITADDHEHGGKIDPTKLPTGSNSELIKAVLAHFAAEVFTCGTCKDGLCEEHCPIHSEIEIKSSKTYNGDRIFVVRVSKVSCAQCPRMNKTGASKPTSCELPGSGYGSGASTIKTTTSSGQQLRAELTRAGDVTYDGYVGFDDVVAAVHALQGSPSAVSCPLAGDLNDSGSLDSADVEILIANLESSGPDYFVENYGSRPCTKHDLSTLIRMSLERLSSSVSETEKRDSTPRTLE